MELKPLKLLIVLVIVFLLNVCAISVTNNITHKAIAALSLQTSSTDKVKTAQTKLKEKGYYSGNVNGTLDSVTKESISKFQKDNNIPVDGTLNQKTTFALGIGTTANTKQSAQYAQGDIDLLARIISAEARGEPYSGQVAVGAVVLNRIEHPSFPDTLSGVVYQPGAFSCLTDGQVHEPVSDSAKRAAQDAINGMDPSSGAIYYYNPEKTTNSFMLSRPVLTVIGKHKFCS